MVCAAAPHIPSGPAASNSSEAEDKVEDWLQPMIKELWPHITKYIEEKIKAKLHDRRIYVDSRVRAVMNELSFHPPPIPFGKDWLNTVLKTVWPLIKHAAEDMIKTIILPQLREKLPSFMQSIDIDPCTLGDCAPQLKHVKVIDGHKLANNRFLGLHFKVEYDGDANIGIVYHGVTAGIRHIKFKMDVFLNFAGKSDVIPFVKGIAMHVDNLGFSMDWTGAFDFLDNEFLEDVIHNIAKQTVQSMMVLPQRMPVSLQPMGAEIFDLVRPRPKGFFKIELLGITGLKGDEISLTTFMGGGRTVDPFVEFRLGSQFWRSKTVSRCLDPTWEEDNTFIFFVDSPGHQMLDIRVFDEDLTTSLRMGLGGSAADTIARALDLGLHKLLVRSDKHHFHEEIQSDLLIPLALWWPGQGKGPEEEDFQKKEDDVTEAERVQAKKTEREEEERKRHEQAQEDMRKRHEAFLEQQRRMEAEAAAVADAGVFTRMKNWFKKEAAEATEWIKEEADYVMEGAEHMIEVVKDEAAYLKDKVVEKVHSHQEANEKARKELLLQADAKIHLRFDWRPIGDAIQPAMFPRGGAIAKPTLQRMLDELPPGPTDSDAEAEASEWPAYALLVGIGKVDKIVVADAEVTECYVACDVTPAVSQDGKLFVKSEDVVTKKKSCVIKPTRASVAGLTASIDESRVMARKIGICLSSGMSVSSVADVLDLDESTISKALGSAITERSDCVDLEFDEDFVYFLHDPETAVINLEVFRNGKIIGTRRMCVGPLLEKPGMTEDFERLPVEDAPDPLAIPRLTGRVQLWPVGRPGSSLAPPQLPYGHA